jgi:hypothetical protein
MNLKLKARWQLFRYHRELRKSARNIDVLQRICCEFRSKHCLDKDSTKRLDIMLDLDKEMCVNVKHDALIDSIRAFRKVHGI